MVTVVIPSYKRPEKLNKLLKSIIEQTVLPNEIIVVDDCSDMDKEYKNVIYKNKINFKKLKYIKNESNFGAPKSRNIGIKNCKGKYIAFMDADDIWLNNKLKYQISFMKRNSILFSFTSYGIINEKNKIIKYRIVNSNPNYTTLSKTNIIGLSTVVFHHNLKKLMKFSSLKTQEDFALWLKLLRSNIDMDHIKKTLSYWRKTEDSLSSNKVQKLKDAFILFYKYENKNWLNSIYCVLVLIINKILKTYKT